MFLFFGMLFSLVGNQTQPSPAIERVHCAVSLKVINGFLEFHADIKPELPVVPISYLGEAEVILKNEPVTLQTAGMIWANLLSIEITEKQGADLSRHQGVLTLIPVANLQATSTTPFNLAEGNDMHIEAEVPIRMRQDFIEAMRYLVNAVGAWLDAKMVAYSWTSTQAMVTSHRFNAAMEPAIVLGENEFVLKHKWIEEISQEEFIKKVLRGNSAVFQDIKKHLKVDALRFFYVVQGDGSRVVYVLMHHELSKYVLQYRIHVKS